ncbi:glycosyltransferase family 4 protein [Candidatus Omnitrophota bacterium]
MNICFLSRDYPPKMIGGVGTYTYEMAKALIRLGHRAYVISEAIDREGEFIEQGIWVNRIKPAELPFPFFLKDGLKSAIERLEYSYAVSKTLRRMIKRYKIDIVESCEARSEGFWYFLLNKRPPLVVRLHTPEGVVSKLNRDPQTRQRWLIERLEEWWLQRANRLSAPTKAIITLVRRYYYLDSEDIPVTPNPLNIDLFKPKPGLKNNFNVLYAGRLEFRKGVHVLIRAVPHVLKEIPQAKFIFVGDDCGMKTYLLAKVKQLKLEDSVEFSTQMPRDKLIERYHESTLCVVPSLWENHPYSVLEPLACAKPVIASNVGGIGEIIEHQINGILIPPGSVTSLAQAIVGVLNDVSLRERLSHNARRYIEQEYAPAKLANQNLEIYQGLLNRA